MSPAEADDQIQAEVERRLRAGLEAAVLAPLGLVRGVESCLRRRVDRVRNVVGQPVRMVRSLFDVVAGVPATPGTSTAGTPTRVVDVEEAPPPVDREDPGVEVDDRQDEGAALDLPIEEYESLAASQIVARLEGLSPSELRAVRRFEAAHRGRRTVLGKIDQLLPAD